MLKMKVGVNQLDVSIMKKVVILFVSSLFILSSCVKEKEQEVVEENPTREQQGQTPAETPADSIFPDSFTASQGAEDTKTSYDADGHAAWVLNDQVALFAVDAATPKNQGWIAYAATTLTNDNKTATFTKVDGQGEKETAMESYTKTGIAVYPASLAQPATGNTGATSYSEVYVTLPSDVSGLASENVLIGTADNAETPTNIDFKSAMAQMRVTVTGIPAQAASLRLYTNDQDSWPLSGNFVLTASKEITHADYRKNGEEHTGREYLAVDLSGEGAMDSHDYFFSIPTGTYPSGTLTLKLLDGDENVLLERSINKELAFNRNDLVRMAGLANQWITLGTGKFYNKQVTDGSAGTTDGGFNKFYHANVVIQQNVSNTNQYRVKNPYGAYWAANNVTPAYTPDEYLTFTVDLSNNRVTGYDDHHIGHNLDASSGNVFIKYANTAQNKVWRKADGKPLIVQLAPLFRYNNDKAGWDRSGDSYNHLIEIIFPDYDTSAELKGKSAVTDDNLILTVVGPNVSQFSLIISNTSGSDALVGMGTTKYSSDVGNGSGYGGYNVTGYWTRHFAYKTFNTDGTEIGLGTFENVKIYSITSADAASICSKYLRNPATGTSIGSASQTQIIETITIAASDDILQGNIMITEFCGRNYDSSVGSPLYGTYSSGTASFKVKGVPCFYNDDDDKSHWVSTCASDASGDYLDITFGGTVGGNTYDLIVQDRYIGDAHSTYYGGGGGGYVVYYDGNGSKNYVANKVSNMITLTESNLTAYSTNSSSGGVAKLCDNLVGGSTIANLWQSNWSGTRPETGADGIWITIDLGTEKTVRNFILRFLTPDKKDGKPSKIKIALSKDNKSWPYNTGELSVLSSSYSWVQHFVSADDNYRYVKLCILEMNGTAQYPTIPISLVNTAENGQHYTNLDEIQLWEQ